jgi:hypothetical protein
MHSFDKLKLQYPLKKHKRELVYTECTTEEKQRKKIGGMED